MKVGKITHDSPMIIKNMDGVNDNNMESSIGLIYLHPILFFNKTKLKN